MIGTTVRRRPSAYRVWIAQTALQGAQTERRLNSTQPSWLKAFSISDWLSVFLILKTVWVGFSLRSGLRSGLRPL